MFWKPVLDFFERRRWIKTINKWGGTGFGEKISMPMLGENTEIDVNYLDSSDTLTKMTMAGFLEMQKIKELFHPEIVLVY